MKKIGLVVAIMGTCISLTGCDIDLQNTFDNYRNSIDNVKERNYQVIEQFYDAGLLTKTESDSLKKTIEMKVDAISNLKSDKDKELFLQSLVSIANDGVGNYSTEIHDDGKEYFKGSDVLVGKKFKKIAGANLSDIGINTADNQDAIPLKLFDTASLTSISDTLNKEVYVLNNNGVNDLGRVVSLLQTIDKMVSEATTDEEKSAVLNSYRQELEKFFTKSDKKVFDFKTTDLVKTTSKSSVIGQTDFVNNLGDDLALTSDSGVVATVRIEELTADAVEIVTGSHYNSKKKYLVMDKTDNTDVARVYLLEYPVDSITDIKLGKKPKSDAPVTDTDWWCDTDYDTDKNGENTEAEDNDKLRVNLMTGEVINSDDSIMNSNTDKKENFYRIDTVAPSFGWYHPITYEKVYQVVGGELRFKESETKVGTDGKRTNSAGEEVAIVDGLMDKKEDTSITRIYLKEYLELTYMPGIVPTEPFIATGRRIKINKLEGNLADSADFGSFVDKTGKPISDLPSLSLVDVIDYQSGSDGYYQNVAEKLGLGADNTQPVKDDLAKSKDDRVINLKDLIGTTVTTDPDGMVADETNDKLLFADAYFNWIRPVIDFGTKDMSNDKQILNTVDADKVQGGQLPKLKGLCVNTNMFKTNLFSSWINVQSDSDQGSIIWWNSWLQQNGFEYQLDQEALLGKLKDVYKVELNNEGYIILDLDVIAKIQKKMNVETEYNIASKIYTLSKLVGFLFISYGVLLAAAWVIDVNFTNGPNLLGKLTGGRWEAVTDLGDMPNINTKENNYITFKLICKNSIIVMAIGVILLFIDIITLRDLLLKFMDVFVGVFRDIFSNR